MDSGILSLLALLELSCGSSDCSELHKSVMLKSMYIMIILCIYNKDLLNLAILSACAFISSLMHSEDSGIV